jgi:hypothetical protein
MCVKDLVGNKVKVAEDNQNLSIPFINYTLNAMKQSFKPLYVYCVGKINRGGGIICGGFCSNFLAQ